MNIFKIYLNKFKYLYKQYPRQYWLLVLGTLVNSLGVSLVWPFLTIYLRAKLDLPLTTITSLISLDASMVLLSSFIAGPIIDSFGRKWVMVIGMAVNGLGYLLMGQADTYWTFAILMILRGTFTPMYHIGADSMVADLVPEGKRLDAYSITRVINNLGFALGPTIGGIIAGRSYSLTFMITFASLTAISLMIVIFMRETKPETVTSSQSTGIRKFEGMASAFKDSFFLKFCAAFTLSKIASSLLFTLLPVYAKENFAVPESQVGWIMLTNGMMIVIFQYFVTHSMRKFPIIPIMGVSAIMYAIGMFSITMGTRIEHFLISMAICTIGELMLMPTSSALVANIAPEDKRGRYMSVFNLSQGVGRGIGPITGGFLSDTFAPVMIWFGGMVMALLSAISYFLLKPAYDKMKTSGRIK